MIRFLRHPAPRWSARAALLALVCSTGLLPAAASGAEWSMHFNQAALGPFTAEDLERLAPTTVRWSEGFGREGGGDGRAQIVDEHGGGGRDLCILFPAQAVGPRVGGAQFMAELPPRESYTLEYRVRFSPDFEWVKGGKLPGLAGGSAPTGGFFDPDGFTSRYMWRSGGRLVLYLYWAGQASSRKPTGAQYAEDLDTGVVMSAGRAYVLRQRIQLNTPGAADGEVKVWVDGRLVLNRNGLIFRNDRTKTWKIDGVFFSTFHGGNDPSWAPRRDVTIAFDDFRVIAE